MILWRFLALLVLVMTGIGVLTIGLFPASEDFQDKNPFWNGLGNVRQTQDATSLSSLNELADYSTESALLVIPYTRLTGKQIEQLGSYLESGGTLILADDFGFGNDVLIGLDISYRFNGAPLLDPLFNYRDEWFPLATEIHRSPFTAGVSSLGLNYGTILEGSEDVGFTNVAYSSNFSFLDHNGNSIQDVDESAGLPDDENSNDPTGPFPLVAYGAVGNGRLILISDPSIFINGMENAEDNARFVANLVQSVSPDASFLLAPGLLPGSDRIWIRDKLIDIRSAMGQSITQAVLIVALVTTLMSPIWRKKEPILG